MKQVIGVVTVVGVLMAILGCGVPPADGPANSYGVNFSLPSQHENEQGNGHGNGQGNGLATHENGQSTPLGAIVFIVDGVNGAIFQQMLEAGELPAIQKYFVSRGLYVPRAVANIPSVTLSNITSIATGRFPGHHTVTGVRWFDRQSLVFRNYATLAQKNTLDGDYTAANVYEMLSPTKSDMTVSIFYQPHRGTTKFFENRLSAAAPYVFGWYEFLDRLTLSRFGKAMNLARKRKQFPLLTCAYLLSPDMEGYRHGVSSKPYRQAIRNVSRQVGRVLGDLKSAGLLDRVVIAMVSDHSLADVKRHFPLEKFLRNSLGLHLAADQYWEQSSLPKRKSYYQTIPAVTAISGDRYCGLYLQNPAARKDTDKQSAAKSSHRWQARPTAQQLKAYPVKKTAGRANSTPKTVDLISYLVRQPAVDAVAWQKKSNCCRIRFAYGELEFAQPGGRGKPITTKLMAGQIPKSWQKLWKQAHFRPNDKNPSLTLAPRQWLLQTNTTQFPDLPTQLLAYFRSPRAGDLAVFAAPSWDFYTQNKAGHGGIRSFDDMHVPLLIAGPGVPQGTLPAARSVDLAATLLQLFQINLPATLDGRPLFAPIINKK